MLKSTRNTLLVLTLILNSAFAFAQLDSVMISGTIYDYESREAISQATFKVNGELVDIAEDGQFQLYVKPNDTLSFRYMGYKDYVLVVPEDLEHVSYISGVFLNKEDIAGSETVVMPREYEAESLANYDPEQMEQMMNNAKHNLNVAAYQATQPYEWDAYSNTKYSLTMKETELEYKNAIASHQQVGVGVSTTLENPGGDVKIDNMGEKTLKHFTPISPKEQFLILTLFEAKVEQGDSKE
jgi:hypothetical protein